MKLNKTLTTLIAGAAFGLSGQVMAVGTEAGTPISNTATLSYTVNSSTVNNSSDVAEFEVDRKIDLTLTDNSGASLSAAAGSTQRLTFSLSNQGNADTFFQLQSTATSPQFYLTSDNSPITDNVLSILKDDPAVSFYIDVAIPDNAADGSTASFEVAAKAVADAAGTALSIPTGDKNANLTGQIFIVYAESVADNGLTLAGGTDRDGGFARQSDVTVSAPELTGTKTVTVLNSTITDSNNETFTTNYAIPGATVEYKVVIENTGSEDAQGVSFIDDLSAKTEFDQSSIANITVLDNSDTALTVNTDYTVVNDGTTDGIVNISLPDITSGEQVTVSFEVTIQ
ncbi:hypothetical protein HF888_11535 [Bermanella marisrubri]|uniref:DUF11 domain-containing protein n=1 Tax=Bermanella marisrubri TaxID=207949 RepID=Q1N143_9GAMM|nr:hypothetical protein [Bermanella marisrubri]EAT12008.1 hypothetical protein RED65_11725 [Oceanobacter sp. RED65] [Bermanella marisrubri]QIZ84813.1 hypothetical protein HF888_11535 [Bermanella marisrubri]